jgi:hypothetical protein
MKRLGLGIMVLIVSLIFTGCFQSDVDSVKNGTYKFDKGITIGKAFDNYKYWKRLGNKGTDPSWKSFETSSGRKIIEFTANYSNEFLKLYPRLELVYDGMKFKIQWSINDDDTLQVHYQSVSAHWKKGKWQEFKNNTNKEIMSSIKTIYNNQR